ncbi:alpha/beta hydrolase [Planomonospora sp. ID67723]|uniref:alpha/beta fold hydrolase n=1 Tax=Planomonospora sp. ID67723 TaxID=2738134 RepID=UPI0018C42A45|nr:alpha/beta hydrolase [Planomonospora sp. ID67723]MBG0831462.1 alpha/beta hydrolase [Planomonospora sp. ID67723]
MGQVTSKDGTTIAYERQGSGPALILVGGGLDDGSENVPLAAGFATSFSVVNYARRGRGDSGDTPPYAVEREIEDLDALIAAAGGSAHVFAVSSGGGLALRAAAAGLAIDRLAVYEVPYAISEEMRQRSAQFVAGLGPAAASERPGALLELFMSSFGSSAEDIEQAKNSSFWGDLVAIEHTIAYDAACMGDYRPPAFLARITQPTLVLTGAVPPDAQPGMGGLPADFFMRAAEAIAIAVPRAQQATVEDSGHVADPQTLVPVVTAFFQR